MMQYAFFDEEKRLNKLSKLGDKLEQLNEIVNWEIFVPVLDAAIPREKNNPKGGRPPYDSLLMFKILVLKRMNGLSDGEMDYMINDRLSFMRFLGIKVTDTIPDANTIWTYGELLSGSEAGKDIFDRFNEEIEKRGYITRKGTLVDASFVEAPRRKNTKEQREKLKEGEIPEEWADPAHPQKLMQRDTDATWTKKGDTAYFGYKNNVKADRDSKIITDYNVTTASTNDVKGAEGLIDATDEVIYADAAYPSLTLPEGVVNMISEKPARNNPLTEEQRAANHEKAKIRCRVEHIFAGMVQSTGGMEIRCKSKKRAELSVGLMNLCYNMRRVLSLVKPTDNWVKRVLRNKREAIA